MEIYLMNDENIISRPLLDDFVNEIGLSIQHKFVSLHQSNIGGECFEKSGSYGGLQWHRA